MENQKNVFDRSLRVIGASLIAFACFSVIGLSLLLGVATRSSDTTLGRAIRKIVTPVNAVENWFYDLRTARFYDHDNKSPNLVILEIDDESLNKVGRWPWTRSKHAKILDNLRAYGAKVVMFDVAFPEPESDEADGAFTAAIKRYTDAKGAVVLGYGLAENPEDALKPLPPSLMISLTSGTVGTSPMIDARAVDKTNFAAAKLADSDALFGFISSTSPDFDGVFRQMQLVDEIDGGFYPSLGFMGFDQFFHNGKTNSVMVEPNNATRDYVVRIKSAQGERDVLLNARGELKIRYFGGPRNFERVPIHEVFFDPNPAANKEMQRIFNGKAVLIGSSAFGAHDLRHLPFDSQAPGMYTHANLFHALDRNFLFQSDDWSIFFSLAMLATGFGLVLLFSRFKSPTLETLGTAVVLAAIYSIDYFVFAPRGYFIRLFLVLAGSAGLYAWFTILNVFHEAREKKKVRDAFSRYVAPEIVKQMLSNPDKLKVGGEKREITMLFSDVRDFTTISERLTAQELSTLLNIYMGKMTDILFESGGTLDKYIGDAMVGFWGAPLDLADHAYHAVRGAKLMLEALPEINKEFENRKFPRINVGIGLNTGEASVGNMGSDKIFQYTALGDNMNLASRLESLTKEYGVNLMISEFTLAKLGDKAREFRMRPLDLVQVKGKSKAVKIFEIIPNWSPWAKEDALLEKFHEAYERKYLQRKFVEAATQFEEILHSIPEDKASKRLLKMAKEFAANPPSDQWDGVTVFTTK
ncbi:MAG: CHASE2 domain-containing protein [Bdellovibrionota bacterium]